MTVSQPIPSEGGQKLWTDCGALRGGANGGDFRSRDVMGCSTRFLALSLRQTTSLSVPCECCPPKDTKAESLVQRHSSSAWATTDEQIYDVSEPESNRILTGMVLLAPCR